MDFSKPALALWRVDETKALGAYSVWTDYPTHPGHDGAGYESEICSFQVIEQPREERDAYAKEIVMLHNASEYQREYGIYAVPVWRAFDDGKGTATVLKWGAREAGDESGDRMQYMPGNDVFPSPAEAICAAGVWLVSQLR